MNTWITETIKKRIREVFEPRYKRPLSDSEVISIAENLSEVVEQIVKFKWKEKYDKQSL